MCARCWGLHLALENWCSANSTEKCDPASSLQTLERLSMIAESYSIGLVILSVVVATLGAYAASRSRNASARAKAADASVGFMRERFAMDSASGACISSACSLSGSLSPSGTMFFSSSLPLSRRSRLRDCVLHLYSAEVSVSLILLASIFMGAAIAGMHYTGMAASGWRQRSFTIQRWSLPR